MTARLPHFLFAVGAVTVLGGILLRRVLGVTLGAPWPPSLGNLEPAATPWLALSVACFAAAVWLAPRALGLRPALYAAVLVAGTLVLRLALAAGRGGTAQWDRVFDVGRYFEADNEYLPALPALDYGRGFFLDRFAELVPSFPVHVAGHPPGLLLVLDALGIGTAAGMAALCIGVGAVSAPLTYGLARDVLPERAARLAGLLMALSPAALMFGVTSADAVYLTVGLVAAWPLARGMRLTGALALAVASFFAWSLLAVGAWAAILEWRRRGVRSAFVLAAACGVVLVAFYGLLWAATGFDPIGTIRATEQVYREGVAAMRPYWYWVLGSPVGFLLVLGLPIAWLALRELAGGSPEAVAVFAVLAIAAVLGFTKAETERIWLPFAPLVILPAARALAARQHALTAVPAALAAQALLHEALFDTVW